MKHTDIYDYIENGKDFYKLKAGRYAFLDESEDVKIVRVPGGWIFYSDEMSPSGTISKTSCFIPFNNEFMKVEEKE